MGNYDDGVGFDRDECGCAYRDPEEQRLGDLSFAWTKNKVIPALKQFLRSLQPEIRFETDSKRFRLVHGSPRRMNEYLFEDRPLSSFQRLAAASEADVLVFGHTHKPYTKRVDGVLFVNVRLGREAKGWRSTGLLRCPGYRRRCQRAVSAYFVRRGGSGRSDPEQWASRQVRRRSGNRWRCGGGFYAEAMRSAADRVNENQQSESQAL